MQVKRSTKLFILVSVIIAVIDIAFVVMNQKLAQHAFESSLEHESKTLKFNFDTLLSQTYDTMLSLATYIANDKQIQQTFLAGKKAVASEGGGAGKEQSAVIRKQLYSMVSDNWAKVQNNFKARQLHFHLGPGSTSFLRVHRPEKFGDNMDDVRFTVVDTNQNKIPVFGFETGRVYSGLRGVVPVSAFDASLNKNVHVGALEVGTSFNSILKILNDNSGYEVGVLLTRDHVKSAMWPEAVKQIFGEEVLRCECVIEAKSDSLFEQIVDVGWERQIRFRDNGTIILEIDGHHYMVSHFPFWDYLATRRTSRESIGAVVFWANIDELVTELRNGQTYNIIYGVSGYIAIELLFYFAFVMATRHLKLQIGDANASLAKTRDRLIMAQQVATLGNWEWKIKSGNVWWSEQVFNIFELDSETVTPDYKLFLSFVHPDDVKAIESAVEKAVTIGGDYAVDHRIITPSGLHKYVRERGVLLRDRKGRPHKVHGTIQDISSEKNLEIRFKEILRATKAGTWEWDLKSDRLIINEYLAEIIGPQNRELDNLKGESLNTFVHPEDLLYLSEKVSQVIRAKTANLDIDVRISDVENNWFWIHIDGQVIHRSINGDAKVLAGTTIDISKRKFIELEHQQLAITDALTGLYNRHYFDQKMEEFVTLTGRTRRPFALMMLDLDGFKPINDTYGHLIGDGVLGHVGKVLTEICRGSDIVARLGGDEFAYILPSVEDESGAEVFAGRVIKALNKPFTVSGHDLTIRASIGGYLYSDFNEPALHAINKADKALYSAKTRGKNMYLAYFSSGSSPLEGGGG